MDKMYGLVDGYLRCNFNRVDEINERISNRNIPSSSLQPQYGIRPVSTKYGYMQVLDQYKNTNVPLHSYKPYNINNVFNPGNANAPWSGYSNNVNTESILRNQFFALQNCEQSSFIPSSKSDLYETKIDYKPVEQTHPLLFKNQEFSPFNPNTLNTGKQIFNNNTRVELKNVDVCKTNEE
tara:strand:+ start:4980 stop:5519 length:540 start_codon:yes stop_codon:yes gene_type:complete